MTTTDDPRLDNLRWTLQPHSSRAHLWLGAATACGRSDPGQPTLHPQRCLRCLAYAIGWLDRNDHQPGRWPNPLGDGPLPISAARAAEHRRVLLAGLREAVPQRSP